MYQDCGAQAKVREIMIMLSVVSESLTLHSGLNTIGQNLTMCERRPPEASTARAARVVAPPIMDEGWQLEYSVHRVSPVIAADVKAAFRNELVDKPVFT
jgi:hypothetical protein